MTEDLRKRLRCLQHLPLTCQFEVAEILLKSPVVSEETLEHFKGIQKGAFTFATMLLVLF